MRDHAYTVYYYGSVMVIHYNLIVGDEPGMEFHTHQLVTQEYKEENNRIMWEKW
jgi:hypothetical protein